MKKKKAMEKLFDFFCVEILICLIRPQSRFPQLAAEWLLKVTCCC